MQRATHPARHPATHLLCRLLVYRSSTAWETSGGFLAKFLPRRREVGTMEGNCRTFVLNAFTATHSTLFCRHGRRRYSTYTLASSLCREHSCREQVSTLLGDEEQRNSCAPWMLKLKERQTQRQANSKTSQIKKR